MKLTRYWIEFEIGLNKIGYGVSGYDFDDAVNLIKDKVFKAQKVPAVKSMIEDVDISTLDSNHVLLNIAPPNFRGISFPLGYQ